jgi:hypothetical protein
MFGMMCGVTMCSEMRIQVSAACLFVDLCVSEKYARVDIMCICCVGDMFATRAHLCVCVLLMSIRCTKILVFVRRN